MLKKNERKICSVHCSLKNLHNNTHPAGIQQRVAAAAIGRRFARRDILAKRYSTMHLRPRGCIKLPNRDDYTTIALICESSLSCSGFNVYPIFHFTNSAVLLKAEDTNLAFCGSLSISRFYACQSHGRDIRVTTLGVYLLFRGFSFTAKLFDST